MRIQVTGITEVQSTLRVMEQIKTHTLDMNKARANAFLKFTKTAVKNAQIGLDVNKPPYRGRKIKKVGHEIPMVYNKYLINHMANRPDRRDGSVESGYFSNDTRKHPDAPQLTMYQLAAIHHAGHHSTPPRPFVWNAGKRFEREMDDAIIQKEVNKIFKRLKL